MCACGAQWIGTSWRSVVEATDGPVPGHCDDCEDTRTAKIRAFEAAATEAKRASSSAPDLELPETSPELADQLDMSQGEDNDRDEYWR